MSSFIKPYRLATLYCVESLFRDTMNPETKALNFSRDIACLLILQEAQAGF